MGAPEIALDKLGVKYRIVLASDIDPEAEAVYKQLHGKNLLKEWFIYSECLWCFRPGWTFKA